jgi:hydroxypyruvate reductase/glycerate 2-kinase
MDYRSVIKTIFEEALDAVMPENFIRKTVSVNQGVLKVNKDSYDLSGYKRVFVFGSGKASAEMAKSVYAILGDRIAGGFVICNYISPPIGQIEVIRSSHPIPTQESINAGERLLHTFLQLEKDDFFIYLLSGGTSALIEKPIPPITLGEFQSVSAMLLKSGMPISEMNVIRKHLSMIKGGRLGRSTKATGVVLVLSDVIGDGLASIGSGPLYCDESTYEVADVLLRKYGIRETIPTPVGEIIKKGIHGQIEDTPKVAPKRIQHYIIGNNYLALTQAKISSEKLGLKAQILTSHLQGEAKEAGKFIMSLGKEILLTGNPWQSPVALIFGGETTVTVRGSGRGGRNQELTLAILREIQMNPHFTFLSAGLDGIDGQSDAAGALVDRKSFITAIEQRMDIDSYLVSNDSNGFFKLTGDLIVTGPTGTNVGDIAILIVH